MDWDTYFINEAYLAAQKSKDRRTQVGAVIVGPDREIRSKGYNGPCRGFDDDDPAIHTQPLKSLMFCHAEENAIVHCARIGTAAKGCTMFVTLHPCVACARMIVQSGIREVVVSSLGQDMQCRSEKRELAQRILRECEIVVRVWSGNLPPRRVTVDGVEIL